MAYSTIERARGAVDGVNTVFTVSTMYLPGSLQIWINGDLKQRDLADGWSELGANRFRLNEAPIPGSLIQVYYRPV